MTTAVLLLFVAMISIQTGAGFAKSLFPIAGAGGATVLRLFFATAALWILYRPWRFRFDRATLKTLCIYGASLGLMNLSFYVALERIPLGLAVTLEFIGPLTLSLCSSRKKVDFLWAFLAAVGIYFIVPHAESEHVLDLIGCGFALLAGMFWAFYIYFGQRASNAVHGSVAATVGMTVAALAVFPFGIAMDGAKILDLSILPLGIAVGLLSSALPYSLEMVALKRMPAKTFSILMSLEPALASLVGLLFLSEHLIATQWMAIVLVMAASLGSVVTAANQPYYPDSAIQ